MLLEEAKKWIGIREDQIWLLKAALFEPSEALKYWGLWKGYWQLDDFTKEDSFSSVFCYIDVDSQRILPLVYRNLENTKDPFLPALRDLYRITWMHNQKLLYRAQQIVRDCNVSKIPTMLLKGIPMSLHYYKDMGVRPMGDVDVLVRLEDVEKAVIVLAKYGNIPSSVEYQYRHIIHAMHCYDEHGIDVDLHWQPFFFQNANAKSIQLDSRFSVLYQLLDTQTNIFSPPMQLFHTVIHGTMGGVPVLRWITDAAYICKSVDTAENIKEFMNLSKEFNLDYAVRLCMEYLHEEFGILSEEAYQEIQKISENRKQKEFLLLSLNYSSNFVHRLWRLIVRQSIAYDLFYEYRQKQSKVRWIFDKILYKTIYELKFYTVKEIFLRISK
ncbi:nucleotidyltransferase family protein [Runella slithyformis]|uniref:Nucleotidyltransferase family protein n=1 Tax=Runella slithyformis (strain ATCC 29530 / DSM 19594 / LMG 11500 / NCIMB 11436 / LSU 4) TaxID=761193 RepID=A0A7U3ZNE7_RUNSL|nr:nucleotidyltransferase family protein [Runella slithyformis]AEI50288.1 hypothetical protein Runsl_3933 [Runella slithyformis DSM 19594]